MSLIKINAPDISNYLSDIKLYLTSHVVNKYSPSNLEILKIIGADEFFGLGAMDAIQDILDRNSYNLQETMRELDQYKNERDHFIKIIKRLDDHLTELNIDEHYSEEIYEIGILMPRTGSGNKILKVTKEFN